MLHPCFSSISTGKSFVGTRASTMSRTLEDISCKSAVAQFYDDRSIFITGATGFMGKVLVEKLLRTTNLRRLYLLIRTKRGVPTHTRLEDLLASKLFDNLREKRPHMLAKVAAVAGDITEDRLGLSPADEELLMSEVSIVFHSAATVKFDEELTKSVAMNVGAVLSIVNLCKQMPNLEALVHVSTAYCNCDQFKISEEIYPPPGSPQGMIQLCKLMEEKVLNSPEMTARLIGNRPNTYTFTKALAETILATEGAGLPIAIVRPSIVTAAWKEPVPGWVDNLNGPTGMLAGASKGLLRTLHCRRRMLADLVPVDIPINLMCCVAWRTATSPSSSVKVYNCTSGALNPLRWGEFEAWGYEAVIKYPTEQLFWFPGGSLKDSRLSNLFCEVVFHLGPAYLFDLLAVVSRRKPFLVNITHKMNKATKALEYFTTHEWRWSNDNTLSLGKQITDSDRQVFDFDVGKIHWPSYVVDYVKGVKHFVFKEDPSNLAKSRQNLNKMYWVEKGLQMVMFVMFWRVILTRSESVGRMWNFLFGLLLRFFRLLPLEAEF